jgi:DNA binding domain, excisionase family
MKQRNLDEIKEKPLFYLTIGEFITLQKKIGKDEGNINTFPEIMSITDAAKFTGYKKSTLYRKTCSKSIPFFKRSNRVLFKKEDLKKWLLSNRQETTEEYIERLENELKNGKSHKNTY